MTTTLRVSAIALSFFFVLGTAACGGSSGGGGGGGGPTVVGKLASPEVEPNNTPGTATPLVIGSAGSGDLVAIGDEDYWSVTTTAPSFLRIECTAARQDQATWAGAGNVAVVTVFDTDGTTKIAEHDNNSDVITGASTTAGGIWDREYDCLRLPAAGTYFIRVAQDNAAAAGGNYVLAITDVTLAGVQFELEGEGMGGTNNTTGTAEALSLGAMQAYLTGGDVDVFAFQIVGVPAIAVFDFKAWRHGAQAGALEYRQLTASIIGPDGVTPVEAGTQTTGYGFDPLMSQLISNPGTYYLVVSEASPASGGAGRYQIHYDLRQVGNITEMEPNDTSGTANSLQEGQFVSGNAAFLDPDFFSFTATAGQLRSIRAWGAGNHDGGGAAAPVTISLFDTDGTTLLPFAAAGLGPSYQLSEQRFLIPADGTYFVRLNTGGASTEYTIRNVLVRDTSFESEGNDTLANANPLGSNTGIAGTVNPAADIDWFSFTAEAGEHVQLECIGGAPVMGADFLRDLNIPGSLLSPILTVTDAVGTPITSSSILVTMPKAHGSVPRLPAVSVSFVAPTAGTYHVTVTDTGAAGGASHHYQLVRR